MPLRGLCADGCRAHAGFKYAAEKLLPPVTEALKEYGCRDVVFTGHSLGGAVATLMGYSVQKGGDFRVDGAYTYEAPRPGDANLARAMEADGFDVVRVTHEGDPVPVLPWYDPLGRRYAHPGREVFYGKTGLRADCLSADCERDANACACSEGWFKRGLPLDTAAHTDFTKTPLDWGEANACPWPRLPSAPLQKLTVR
jgi:Lipase (class 3)